MTSATTAAPTAPAPAETPVLELIDVRKAFRADVRKRPQIAIDGVSCRFSRGACTGLLGHNGAGKTTAIRLILGLIQPDSGAVRYNGRRLLTADKRHIGYMPEVSMLPGALTASEVLYQQLELFAPEGLTGRAQRHAAVAATLAEVGLAGHGKRRIQQLSKGMLRRLAWAQATIHKPSLLILDEPSSGLDPLGRRQMLNWIAAAKRAGTSVVLCTHEMAMVSALCDDLHILRRGKLALTSVRGAPGSAEPNAEHPVWLHKYMIQVSGLAEAEVRAFGSSKRLPDVESVKQEGFLAVLGFDDYEASALWLAALLGTGYVVVRFGDETFLSEDELMKYFAGEE